MCQNTNSLEKTCRANDLDDLFADLFHINLVFFSHTQSEVSNCFLSIAMHSSIILKDTSSADDDYLYLSACLQFK